MTDTPVAHEAAEHCHHNMNAAECTLCTYLALERKYHQDVLELIDRMIEKEACTCVEGRWKPCDACLPLNPMWQDDA